MKFLNHFLQLLYSTAGKVDHCYEPGYAGYTQKNGAVSKGNKKFIPHLTRVQRTPSAATTVQISHTLPAVCFSCLLWGQFPRWHRSRKKLSVCSVLRCPDLWLQCSMNFMHGLEKTHLAGASFLNRATRNSCWWHMSVVSLPVVCYVPSTVMTAWHVSHPHCCWQPMLSYISKGIKKTHSF